MQGVVIAVDGAPSYLSGTVNTRVCLADHDIIQAEFTICSLSRYANAARNRNELVLALTVVLKGRLCALGGAYPRACAPPGACYVSRDMRAGWSGLVPTRTLRVFLKCAC